MNLLVLMTVFLLQVSHTKSQCPASSVSNCTCENIPGQSRRNIKCVDLTNIPTFSSSPEIFQKLDMDFPSNRIAMIQANAFQGILVEEIDMSGVNIKLQSIHQMAFTGLEQHLKSIKLQGDQVLLAPFEQLKNMTILEVLELHYLKLTTIEETTKFDYFPNLKTLKLRNMGTNFVSRESFKNQLLKLTVFEFSNNNVPTFPAPAINRLRTLTHLYWLHNGMTSIAYGSFDSLNNLVELDLRGNDISQLDLECFNGITEKLEFLSLQLNKLTKDSIVPLGNYMWPKLEQLNLGHMTVDFTDIPNGLFSNMAQLANLMIPGNKLRRIKTNDFQGLQNMHSLDLSENWISTIEEGALSHMTRLDTLDLRNQYDISNINPFNFTLEAIQGVQLAVKSLYLQENHLIDQHAWEAIGALKNLVNLDISNTGLSQIPSLVFYSHDKLKSLIIRSNKLSVLRQDSLYGLQYSLETIDFSNNTIYTIDTCVFKGFNKLNHILGSQNPIACDCNLYGFHQFLNSLDLSSFANVLCNSPANLRNSEVKSLTANELCSNPPTETTCPVFTTTTLAPITTTTPSVPIPHIQFDITSQTRSTIVISWVVTGDMTYLKNFLVQYKQLGINNPDVKSFLVDRSKRDHAITGLAFGSSYEICFFLELTVSTKQILIKCSNGQTQDIPDPTTPPTNGDAEANTGDETVKIVGGVLGGFVIIAIIVILFIVITLRRKKDTKPPIPPPNGNVTPVGYLPQQRPTSQPKVFVRKANGEMEVMALSNGKLDTSRFSGGSYQNISPKVSNDPYPTKGGATGGTEHGEPDRKQLQVNLPPEHKPGDRSRDIDRYTKMPQNPLVHYINEPQRRDEPEHYTNAVEERPLPQTPRGTNPLSSSGGGFLNHGFTSSPTDTPTDNEYYEINAFSGTVV